MRCEKPQLTWFAWLSVETRRSAVPRRVEPRPNGSTAQLRAREVTVVLTARSKNPEWHRHVREASTATVTGQRALLTVVQALRLTLKDVQG